MMKNKAVFLDRDGTVMEDSGYLNDPSGVKLLGSVELAIKSLRGAGFKIVIVTNQSAVARGMLSEETLEAVHAELRRQLAEKDATLDAIYYCPYHPAGTVAKYAQDSDLRKPAPGMLIKAAEQLDIDLSASWMVGDSARDTVAGRAAGCRTIRLGSAGGDDQDPSESFAANLLEAAQIIIRSERQPAEQSPAEPDTIEEAEEIEEITQDHDQAPEQQGSILGEDSEVRKEILRHVRQMSKQAQTEQFNITNLLGGVTQVLVGLFLVLVFWKALGKNETDQAILWAVIAAVFQTMSLTFFMMARHER